jgi:hypothetical protein
MVDVTSSFQKREAKPVNRWPAKSPTRPQKPSPILRAPFASKPPRDYENDNAFAIFGRPKKGDFKLSPANFRAGHVTNLAPKNGLNIKK